MATKYEGFLVFLRREFKGWFESRQIKGLTLIMSSFFLALLGFAAELSQPYQTLYPLGVVIILLYGFYLVESSRRVRVDG